MVKIVNSVLNSDLAKALTENDIKKTILSVGKAFSKTSQTYINSVLKGKEYIEVGISSSNAALTRIVKVYATTNIGFCSFHSDTYYVTGNINFDNTTGKVSWICNECKGFEPNAINLGNIYY